MKISVNLWFYKNHYNMVHGISENIKNKFIISIHIRVNKKLCLAMQKFQ